MALRRERRQRQASAQHKDLVTRVKEFATGWGGLIGFSVALVALVLAAGIFRLPLPFLNNTPDQPPDTWGTVMVHQGGVMRIAYIGDTSNGASIDASGATAAIRQVLKDRPKVKDADVELVTVEDACNAEAAAAKAQSLIADPQLAAVISGACPASQMAARAVFEESHHTYIVINGNDVDLTLVGTQNTFRMSWNQKDQGGSGATAAFQDLSLRRALVFYDSSRDAEAVAKEFASAFRKERSGPVGGQVADVTEVSARQSDLESAGKRIVALQPDLIFFAGSGAVAKALRAQASAADYNGQFMVNGSAQQDPAYTSAGAALEGTLAVQTTLNRGAGYDTWKETYERDNGPVGPLSAEAFDAAQLLLQAMDTAARAKDNRVELGRRSLSNTVRVFPYDGVTGRSGFDSKGDRILVMTKVARYQDGAYAPIPRKAQPLPEGVTVSGSQAPPSPGN